MDMAITNYLNDLIGIQGMILSLDEIIVWLVTAPPGQSQAINLLFEQYKFKVINQGMDIKKIDATIYKSS